VAVSNKHHPNKRPVDHATIIDNPTPKKRRKRAPVADAENIPPNMLNMGDYAAIQASESSTTISTARIAGVLKERHTEASLPPKTKVYDALINRTHAFDGLFTSLELPPNTKSDDGAAVMCTDVVMLIDLIATFRGKNPKDVARIKLSGDGGQGSIKISLQVLFTDDPLLLLPHEVNEALAERHLNSGVKRTFILTLIAGVSESHDIVQWIMQHLQPERLFDTYDHAVITFPADMKFQQYLAGLQQHSARHGYLYRMWSMFSAHSRPDEPRDKRSLLKDAEEFRSAVERDPTTSPIDFNNSIHVPIQFILLSPLPLLLELPPPILHILLGVVKKFLEQMHTLCQRTATQFIHSVNVGHSQHRGLNGYALVGNDCLKVLKNAPSLMCMPSLKRKRRLRNQPAPAPDDTYVSDQTHDVIRLLREVMMTFRTAYIGVSRPVLAENWEPAIRIFATAHSKYAAAYNKVKPQAQKSRNPDLLTPKLFCFINDVPRWIHKKFAASRSLEIRNKPENRNIRTINVTKTPLTSTPVYTFA